MRSQVNSPDYVFLSLVGVLVIFGLVSLASASSVFSYEKFGSSFYLLRHQIIYGVIPGLILCGIAMKMPYPLWRRIALPFYGAVVLLLILVLIPGLGRKLGGARSWFTIGSISFQPAEFAKLGLVLYLAAWTDRMRGGLRDLKTALPSFTIIVGIVALLIVLQPDVGTLSIVGALVVFLVFLAGARMKHLAAIAVIGILALTLLVKIAPYRAARLTSFAHPELDPQGIGYHINQALLAVGSGGVWGVGFGHSRQKFRYLPEVTGDSIFPVIAEEMGFIISAGFILLIVAIIWRMFRIARDAPDYFSRIVVSGIAGWFGIQSFVNLGSMLGLLPLTGLPLPFVSYGGTALTVELLAVGIVGSISRHAK